MMKPPTVAAVVAEAIQSDGAYGRGACAPNLAAGRVVFATREKLATLFGAPSASQVAFAANATEALNTAITGLLKPGDHVITTAASHNSLLRPLYRAEEQGCELDILTLAGDASMDYDAFEQLFKSNTRLVAITQASNVTGDIYDVARMARIAHAHEALLLVDAAQTAGIIPVDMGTLGADVLVFSGHKGLLGPQGTGGLCVAEAVEITPLIIGGTGLKSFEHSFPEQMPERLEAGTLNSHGIAGLNAALDFILDQGVESIAAIDRELTETFEQGLLEVGGARIWGGHADIAHGPVVSISMEGIDSSELCARLSNDYGICTRAGAHCAPLMHDALGTHETGVVRFSFSVFNTVAEVDEAVQILRQISDSL